MDSRKDILIKCLTYLEKLTDFEISFQEILDNALCEYNLTGKSFIDEYMVKLIFELLEKLYLDYEKWIRYFVYDLNFGKKWQPGMIIGTTGEDIKLQTIDDLNTFLEQKIMFRSRQSIEEIDHNIIRNQNAD